MNAAVLVAGAPAMKQKWPWRAILFLHLIFWASVINPKEVPFRVDRADTVAALEQSREEGLVGRRVALVLLGSVALIGLVGGDGRRLRLNGLLGWLVVAFIAWSLLSLTWADDSFLTGKKLFAFCVFWAGAVWAALRLSYRDLIMLAFASNLLTWVLSWLCEVVFGLFRPWESGYRFAGLYHPNGTGQCLGLVVLSSVTLLMDEQREKRMVYAVTTCLGFVFLILTGSRTALFGTIAALLTILTLRGGSPRRGFATLALVSAWIGAAFLLGAVLYGDVFVDRVRAALLLGRNDIDVGTLSLRTPMWKEVIERYIAARPLTGYGYGAFWTAAHAAAISLIVPGMVFVHSHNGYLEMALSIGVVGAAVYVMTIVIPLIMMLRRGIRGERACAFAAAVLVMMLIAMFTETLNLAPALMPSSLSMIVIAKCAFEVPGGITHTTTQRAVLQRRGVSA